MKNLIIRPAQKEEIDILITFEQGIVETERPMDSTLKDDEIHYYDLTYLIETPIAEVVVAEIDGQLVGSGYALIKEAKPYQKHTHYAYLGFMYVKPEYRGKGVNKAILESLKQWAINKNIREIRLEVYQENIGAKKAYEKAGFKGNLLEMRMSLE
ncbi:GNAT family N-acetyltransferase [Emticicia agri]|uniref:GNAT family N-acetyltransferase n=1 Tax=Emticicia agri TaxID=2492393 RepID=A0A4Q5LZT0_9BACT|nr:GNAT family N-acetyltransferase [Emticicia agri]RYU95225.1 GNAT family N-acetyltransferase [Emticicia agri]